MDEYFPTLFSKTFFILGTQLFITWATTQLLFSYLKRGDPLKVKDATSPILELQECNPKLIKLLGGRFWGFLFVASTVIFIVLLVWGIHQPLAVSFTLFSIWAFMTGLQLEFILLFVEHGLGRRVLALTATCVFAAGAIGIFSEVDFGYLQLPLFIALCGLIGINMFRLLRGMGSAQQRLSAGFGVCTFTLYLVFDFNMLAKKAAAGANGWDDAMSIAIKVYLDIINLFLHLLELLAKSHN